MAQNAPKPIGLLDNDFQVGELAPVSRRSVPWATVRTAVAVVGLIFSAGALALACLDYVGESYESCVSADGGTSCDDGGTTTTSTSTGNGSGS